MARFASITLALVALLAASTTTDAFVNHAPSSHSAVLSSSMTALNMGKGKNIPPQMRGAYKKQREMAAMREQMIQASQPGSDGLPVFNLFVRTKKANVSSPRPCCGDFLHLFYFLRSMNNSGSFF